MSIGAQTVRERRNSRTRAKQIKRTKIFEAVAQTADYIVSILSHLSHRRRRRRQRIDMAALLPCRLLHRATRPNIRKIRITSINKKIIRNEKCLASSTADASSPRESTTFVYVCRVGALIRRFVCPFVARLYIWITLARHRAQMVSVYVVVVVVRLFTKYTHTFRYILLLL